MLTYHDKDIIYKHTLKGEGNISHMYLDSKGHVTAGIGHLLANVEAAQQLSFHTRASKKATAEQIKVDFEAVKKQVKNLDAGYYRKFTKLHLKRIDIDALVYEHIDGFHRELKQIFSDFDSYPKAAQYALFDIIYTQGYPDLAYGFPNLVRAVELRVWHNAADESHRKVQEDRNERVYDLFKAAAQEADKARGGKDLSEHRELVKELF